jgi:hypothetical protein
MKKLLVLLICGFFVISVIPVNAQKFIPNSSVNAQCYAGTKVNRIYIPPPPAFFKKSQKKGRASITVYYTGFPTDAQNAFDYAVSILESVLPENTRLTIVADWEKIQSNGILGQTSITGYAAGWGINAQNPRAYYPVALAEKIAGESLNEDTTGDLVLRINSSMNWYLGTDGSTPSQKFDLVTVVIHEICHGLGFYDSMNTDGSLGWWGINSFPMIYDTFIEDQLRRRLTDTLKYFNYSTELYQVLTGNMVFFNGPLLSNFTSGQRAKLYAPSVWDPGSSISHLDEEATLQLNSLMTPFIDPGEAIHNPGKYTLSILGDLGWVNTRISTDSIHDTEEHLAQIELSASIISDTLYDHNKVGVVYSFDKFASSDTVYMLSPNSDDSYNAIINIPAYNSYLQYYYYVEDCFLRIYRSPSLYDVLKYSVYIGTDTMKPVITHTPALYYMQTVDTVNINAGVYDNLGLDTVYIEYKVNNGASEYIGMKGSKKGDYKAVINTKLLSLNGGDSLKYRIFAVDTAKIPNTGILPAKGYFAINIEAISSVLDNYSTDFSDAGPDFFNIGFDIDRPVSFSNYGLNTEHPYKSPEDNSKSINSVALLRHPVKFNESGMLITFNELVLVEPGEPGTDYGSLDFYDYVIVEGSKDFGRTWFALSPGYDCREYSSWETAYLSKMSADEMNSTFTGTEDMLKKKTVYYPPSASISAGDTLMVRFRLFSDPYANGWGWVIENLKIGPLIDAVSEINYSPLLVYPNPGRGIVNITSGDTGAGTDKPMRYSVFNSAGICIIKEKVAGGSETTIDISGYPTGLYIIVLYRDDGIRRIKYYLIK